MSDNCLTEPCLTERQLVAVVRGQVAENDVKIAAHLEHCSTCRQKLDALTGDTTVWESRARRHGASSTTASDYLQRALAALQSAQPSARPFVPRLDFLEPTNRPGVLGLFSGYEVIEHVASGGMGIVLQARDPKLDRIVALKILSPILAANELARARFVREARAAAAVTHEHVVPIYAVDEWRGLPFLVMQFIQGRTLAEKIQAGAIEQRSGAAETGQFPSGIEFAEIIRLGAETAAGLAAAHAQGLIHRDIKPGNILLESDAERVKLTDFGLARAADDAHLTSPGDLAGTPEYMSPEQAGETEVDARSDLFSLGTVLYAMVTGGSPFRAPTSLATMRRVCEFKPPPLHNVHPIVPRPFSELVERLMNKNQAARLQTAAEVAHQLAEWQTRPPVEPTPSPRRWVLWFAPAALVMLLALGWWLRHALVDSRRTAASGGPAIFTVYAPDGTRRGEANSLAGAAAVSQSGDTIEIGGEGSFATAPVQLTGKALRLRAAPRAAPVLVATNANSPLIATDFSLVIEGLALEFVIDRESPRSRRGQTPPSLEHHLSVRDPDPADPIIDTGSTHALVESRNAPLSISHSRLHYRGHHHSLPTAASSCVELIGGRASCVITDSELIGINATGVRWSPGSDPMAPGGTTRSLVLTNAVFAGRTFLNPILPGPPIDVTLVRSTISVADGVIVAAGMPLVRIAAQHCLFDVRFLVHELRQSRLDSPTARLKWSDSGCHFSVRNGFVGRQRTAVIDNLAEWNAGWSQRDTGSIEGAVRFLDMVGPTADLSALRARHFAATSARGTLDDVGAALGRVGPGAPYDQRRQADENTQRLK